MDIGLTEVLIDILDNGSNLPCSSKPYAPQEGTIGVMHICGLVWCTCIKNLTFTLFYLAVEGIITELGMHSWKHHMHNTPLDIYRQQERWQEQGTLSWNNMLEHSFEKNWEV